MSKLSEKDLMRCKCVSKEWHRIITHVCIPKLSIEAPVFGVYFRIARFTCKLRKVTSISPPDVKMQLHNRMAYDDSVHSIDCSPLKVHPQRAFRSCALYDTSACESMYYASILPFDHRGPDFLDCCNGLLLFVRCPKPQFYVCNPAIKQCVPIPLPPPTIHLPSLYASLAFDPSESIHFRIVISSLTTQPQCLHIFYSQTGEWMTHEIEVKLLLPHDCFRLLRHCVYFKGMLYRLSLYHRILCFDLETKKACIFASPNKVQDTLPGCLGVLAGSLSYAKEECGHLWVWLRDSHSEPSVWILKYKISLAHICDLASRISIKCFNVWLHPYAFHPKSDILFVGSARSLMMYHLDSDHMEIVRKNGILGRVAISESVNRRLWYITNSFPLRSWEVGPNGHLCKGKDNAVRVCDKNVEEVLDDWCFTEQ
uniref:F-box domain-containing protein n=1 Tax=Chenopodium quinoa TaxID=63459 RepID=A0A803MVR8_CHEQI